MYQIQDWSRGKTWVFPYEIFGWERLKHFLMQNENFDKRAFIEKSCFDKIYLRFVYGI